MHATRSRLSRFHRQLSPLDRVCYPEFICAAPLDSLALGQRLERESWLSRKEPPLCGNLPKFHGSAGHPEPFTLAPEALAAVAERSETAGLEFWRQFCERLFQVKDLLPVSELVRILICLEKADFRDTALLSGLVDEFLDDRDQLTAEEAKSVLRVYNHTFNVHSTRLEEGLEGRISREGIDTTAALRDELKRKPEEQSLSRLIKAAKSGIDAVDISRLRDAMEKAKGDRSLHASSACVCFLGSESGDLLVDELIRKLLEETSGKDRSWATPQFPESLPPLTAGAELPIEYTGWKESPTLGEEATQTVAIEEPSEEREVESILFSDSPSDEGAEKVSSKRLSPAKLLVESIRRRSVSANSVKVAKMSVQDLRNRNEVAQAGFAGLEAATHLPRGTKRATLIDLCTQLLAGSAGGLTDPQLLSCARILESIELPEIYQDDFPRRLQSELQRRSLKP